MSAKRKRNPNRGQGCEAESLTKKGPNAHHPGNDSPPVEPSSVPIGRRTVGCVHIASVQLAVYLGSSGGDDETTECCDNDCQRTSDSLAEERCIWCFGISSPIYSMSDGIGKKSIMEHYLIDRQCLHSRDRGLPGCHTQRSNSEYFPTPWKES